MLDKIWTAYNSGIEKIISIYIDWVNSTPQINDGTLKGTLDYFTAVMIRAFVPVAIVGIIIGVIAGWIYKKLK